MVELIIYLEPSNPLKGIINEFIEDTSKNLVVNTAIKYNAHITMTGFFTVSTADEAGRVKDQLNSIIEQYKTKLNTRPLVQYSPSLVEDSVNEPTHLLLPVTVSDEYVAIMQVLASHGLPLRIKKINHISLAYWDEPLASSDEHSQWLKHRHLLKKATQINFKQAILETKTWDIVLYERICKGVYVNEPHQFRELARWSLSYD
ncbi:hypothetical protein BDB01DRAFT_130620 [Pilobolus umbonatus]|nr:hypothetical protein BDB01DRAFT_130620 [Pilobolus umbonatus]